MFPDVLEWHHDETRFVDVVLKTVVGTSITMQPPGAKRAMTLEDLKLTDEKPLPAFGSYKVHLMAEYRDLQATTKNEGHVNLYEEIAASFEACGIQVQDFQEAGVPSIALVCTELYTRPEINAALESLLGPRPEVAPASAGATAAGAAKSAVSAFLDPLGAAKKAQAIATSKPQAKPIKPTKKAPKKEPKKGLPAKSPPPSPPPSPPSFTGKLKVLGRVQEVEAAPILFLPFYSTMNTPAWYKRRAPAMLKDHPTFAQFEFEPWPASPDLQLVAAALVAERLAKSSNPVNTAAVAAAAAATAASVAASQSASPAKTSNEDIAARPQSKPRPMPEVSAQEVSAEVSVQEVSAPEKSAPPPEKSAQSFGGFSASKVAGGTQTADSGSQGAPPPATEVAPPKESAAGAVAAPPVLEKSDTNVADELLKRRQDALAEEAAVAAASKVKAEGGSVKERAAAAAAAAEAVRASSSFEEIGAAPEEAPPEPAGPEGLLQASPRVPTPRDLMRSNTSTNKEVVRL